MWDGDTTSSQPKLYLFKWIFIVVLFKSKKYVLVKTKLGCLTLMSTASQKLFPFLKYVHLDTNTILIHTNLKMDVFLSKCLLDIEIRFNHKSVSCLLQCKCYSKHMYGTFNAESNSYPNRESHSIVNGFNIQI